MAWESWPGRVGQIEYYRVLLCYLLAYLVWPKRFELVLIVLSDHVSKFNWVNPKPFYVFMPGQYRWTVWLVLLFWCVLPIKAKVCSLLVLYGHYGSAATQLQPSSLQDQADDGAASPCLPGALLATWQRGSDVGKHTLMCRKWCIPPPHTCPCPKPAPAPYLCPRRADMYNAWARGRSSEGVESAVCFGN